MSNSNIPHTPLPHPQVGEREVVRAASAEGFQGRTVGAPGRFNDWLQSLTDKIRGVHLSEREAQVRDFHAGLSQPILPAGGDPILSRESLQRLVDKNTDGPMLDELKNRLKEGDPEVLNLLEQPPSIFADVFTLLEPADVCQVLENPQVLDRLARNVPPLCLVNIFDIMGTHQRMTILGHPRVLGALNTDPEALLAVSSWCPDEDLMALLIKSGVLSGLSKKPELLVDGVLSRLDSSARATVLARLNGSVLQTVSDLLKAYNEIDWLVQLSEAELRSRLGNPSGILESMDKNRPKLLAYALKQPGVLDRLTRDVAMNKNSEPLFDMLNRLQPGDKISVLKHPEVLKILIMYAPPERLHELGELGSEGLMEVLGSPGVLTSLARSSLIGLHMPFEHFRQVLDLLDTNDRRDLLRQPQVLPSFMSFAVDHERFLQVLDLFGDGDLKDLLKDQLKNPGVLIRLIASKSTPPEYLNAMFGKFSKEELLDLYGNTDVLHILAEFKPECVGPVFGRLDREGMMKVFAEPEGVFFLRLLLAHVPPEGLKEVFQLFNLGDLMTILSQPIMLLRFAVTATPEQFNSILDLLDAHNRRNLLIMLIKFPSFTSFILTVSVERVANIFHFFEGEDLKNALMRPGVSDALAERLPPELWTDILTVPSGDGYRARFSPEDLGKVIAQPKVLASLSRSPQCLTDVVLCLHGQGMIDTLMKPGVLDTIMELPPLVFGRIVFGSVDTHPRLDSEGIKKVLLRHPGVLDTLIKLSPSILNKMFDRLEPKDMYDVSLRLDFKNQTKVFKCFSRESLRDIFRYNPEFLRLLMRAPDDIFFDVVGQLSSEDLCAAFANNPEFLRLLIGRAPNDIFDRLQSKDLCAAFVNNPEFLRLFVDMAPPDIFDRLQSKDLCATFVNNPEFLRLFVVIAPPNLFNRLQSEDLHAAFVKSPESLRLFVDMTPPDILANVANRLFAGRETREMALARAEFFRALAAERVVSFERLADVLHGVDPRILYDGLNVLCDDWKTIAEHVRRIRDDIIKHPRQTEDRQSERLTVAKLTAVLRMSGWEKILREKES